MSSVGRISPTATTEIRAAMGPRAVATTQALLRPRPRPLRQFSRLSPILSCALTMKLDSTARYMVERLLPSTQVIKMHLCARLPMQQVSVACGWEATTLTMKLPGSGRMERPLHTPIGHLASLRITVPCFHRKTAWECLAAANGLT